jgi:acyl-CoA synthetase (AMP-forming)/AMP-acid ligase II
LLARAPAGSVVSFMLPNWHEAAVIYHAVTLAGMVAHPILPSLRDQELSFMLQDVRSRLVFIPAEHRKHDYVAMMDRVAAKLEPRPEVVVVRGDARSHTAADLLASGLSETCRVWNRCGSPCVHVRHDRQLSGRPPPTTPFMRGAPDRGTGSWSLGFPGAVPDQS